MSPQSPRLAIATYALQPDLYGEEKGLVPLLRESGVHAEAVRWDDPAADWASFDAVVLRSTWDYFKRFGEFNAWLDRVEKITRVHNAPALVRWNADKTYLRDLEARGVRIIPTVFCDRDRPADLAAILAQNGWSNAVMKPSVSGGAFRTYRVGGESPRGDGDPQSHQAEMNAILATSSVLVQPFFPEIQTEGEWSFVFFGGALSHTIQKRPAPNDYRIQPEFGGVFREVHPEPWLVDQVSAIVSALPSPPAYARIDGVRRGRDFYLMEAELIEPYLYTSAAPGSLARCARLMASLARAS